MKKEKMLFEAKRKMQVLASKFASPEFLSGIYYYYVYKQKLNLKNPIYFNEKIQWLKLNYFFNNDNVIIGSDKSQVYKILKKHNLEQYQVNIIGSWDSWEKVQWESLPNQFVLKCTHGSGYNIVVEDKKVVDKVKIGRTIKKWLSEDYSLYNAELHYSHIQPKIICEEYLGKNLIDYKFYCFHGKPEFFYVAKEHDKNPETYRMTYYNMDGTVSEMKKPGVRRFDNNFSLSEKLPEMINIAKKMALDFPFVRVDLMLLNDKIYFSELTFTPGAGLSRLEPEKYYEIVGSYLDLSELDQ